MVSNLFVFVCLALSSYLVVEGAKYGLISTLDKFAGRESSLATDKNLLSRQKSIRSIVRIRGGSSNVIHITSAAEFDKIASENEGKLLIVDFSAAWCMPCKLIAPVFEEMASSDGEFSSAIFIKIDVDEVPELAERFQVQAMPTFIFMKNNAEVDRFSGASVEKLKQTIMANFL